MIEYAISACLCGINCRYDGRTKVHAKCKKLYDEGKAILICPEVMGGLETPRVPSEIVGDKVLNKVGVDNTEAFSNGVEVALKAIKEYSSIHTIILKEGSPSCGTHKIYDGSFSGVKIAGQGMFARVLDGYQVLSEEELDDMDFQG